MPSSGHLFSNSQNHPLPTPAAAAFASFNTMANYPRQFYFSPTACGTVDRIQFHMVSTGAPNNAKPINFAIWEVLSGGNPFTAVASADWRIVASGQIDPGSVPAGTGINSNYWLDIPLSAPFFMDDAPYADFLTEIENRHAYGYTFKWERTAANSDGDTNNSVGIVIAQSANLGGGVSVSAGNVRNAGSDFQDYGVGVQGMIIASSLYNDLMRPAPQLLVNSVIDADDLLSLATVTRRATRFYAANTIATRIHMDLACDGSTAKRVYASIWDTNASSDLPASCIGTSQLVSGGDAGLWTGDVNDLSIPAMFLFNVGSGVTMTLSAAYWAALEISSTAADHSGSDHIAPWRVLAPGERRASYTGSWTGVASQAHHLNVWYAEAPVSPPPPPPPASAGSGAVYRAYPVGAYRSYPVRNLGFPRG